MVGHLEQFSPGSLSLYLGHTKGIQHLRNVPQAVTRTYLAEDHLSWDERQADEERFVAFFRGLLSGREEGGETGR